MRSLGIELLNEGVEAVLLLQAVQAWWAERTLGKAEGGLPSSKRPFAVHSQQSEPG